MTDTRFSDEVLMAFADDELDAVTRTAVEQAMASDENLAARIAVFSRTRDAAREALAPLLDEPLPEALRANVQAMIGEQAAGKPDGDVVAFPKPAAKRLAASGPRWALPLAASLMLAVGGFAGYLVGASDGDPGSGGLQRADLDQPGIVDALGTIPSGSEAELNGTGNRFRAIASFKDAGGTFCREFEVDHADRSTVVSVACRPGSGEWQVRFTVAAPAATDDGYAPASSLDSLEAYLTAVGAGTPMSPEDEASALGSTD